MIVSLAVLALPVVLALLAFAVTRSKRRTPEVDDPAEDITARQRIYRKTLKRKRGPYAVAFLPVLLLAIPSCSNPQQRADLHSVCSTAQTVGSGVTMLAKVGSILDDGAPTWVQDLDAIAPQVASGIVGVLCLIDTVVVRASHGQPADPARTAKMLERAATYRKMRTPVLVSKR